MRALYSPSNQAWLVTMGSDTIVPIGSDNRTIFNSLEELDAELAVVGLKRQEDNTITLKD